MLLDQLETPCLLLKASSLRANINSMVQKAADYNVALRTHAKTCKSAEIMSYFSDNSKLPITVSTLKEAEYFASHGFNDILYAVCITPDKLSRVESLLMDGVNITVVLDSLAAATAVIDYGKQHSLTFSVAIEVDCDGHRAGLVPEDPNLTTLAKLLSSSKEIQFWGVMTHGGGSYDCDNWEQVCEHAINERAAITNVAELLRNEEITCENVSLGSTPTVVAGEDFDGVTEVRPGVFVFFDLFQAQLGACQYENIALSVLATVTSHKPEANRMFIDAGGLALSKDRSTGCQARDFGYGLVCSPEGTPLFDGRVIVNKVNQEHGVIDLPVGLDLADFPVGSKLRVLPNHACMTAAAYQGYHLLEENGGTRWVERCNGW